MNAMPTPRRIAPDSPSRQLLYELNQLFISDQAEFLERLDRENAAREKIHREALAAAAAAHEKVRQSVELERRRLDEHVKAERERRDAKARREIEELQRERAAREAEEKRLEVERAKEREEEKKRLAELDRQHQEINEATRLREQKEKEEAERRVRDQQAAQQQEKQQSIAPTPQKPQTPAFSQSTTPINPPPTLPQPAPQTTSSSTRPVVPQANNASRDSGLENEHTQYLEIHKRLKELRTFMTAESKKIPALKESMGDMRRQIRKCVGQLTHSKTQKGVNNQSVCFDLLVFMSLLKLLNPDQHPRLNPQKFSYHNKPLGPHCILPPVNSSHNVHNSAFTPPLPPQHIFKSSDLTMDRRSRRKSRRSRPRRRRRLHNLRESSLPTRWCTPHPYPTI